MRDSQCVALMAMIARSTLVLADTFARKGLLPWPSIEFLNDEQAVELASGLLDLAKQKFKHGECPVCGGSVER